VFLLDDDEVKYIGSWQDKRVITQNRQQRVVNCYEHVFTFHVKLKSLTP